MYIVVVVVFSLLCVVVKCLYLLGVEGYCIPSHKALCGAFEGGTPVCVHIVVVGVMGGGM